MARCRFIISQWQVSSNADKRLDGLSAEAGEAWPSSWRARRGSRTPLGADLCLAPHWNTVWRLQWCTAAERHTARPGHAHACTRAGCCSTVLYSHNIHKLQHALQCSSKFLKFPTFRPHNLGYFSNRNPVSRLYPWDILYFLSYKYRNVGTGRKRNLSKGFVAQWLACKGFTLEIEGSIPGDSKIVFGNF